LSVNSFFISLHLYFNKMSRYLKYFIGIWVIFSFASCNTNNPKSGSKERQEKHALSSIEFYETEYDFGTIAGGELVTHRFIFKNTGNAGLYISKVMADCGCTVADYEKDEVKPGAEGYIELIFNSEGFRGLQIKKVNVYANTIPPVHELTIAATIK